MAVALNYEGLNTTIREELSTYVSVYFYNVVGGWDTDSHYNEHSQGSAIGSAD